MSEEILRAMMELFALIVKQDGGMLPGEKDFVSVFLTKQLPHQSADKFMNLFLENAGPMQERKKKTDADSASVRDSIRIFNNCKKINKTLSQEQRVIVLMRCIELIDSDKQYTPQRMNIINTIAEVFKISHEEFGSIMQFVKEEQMESFTGSSMITIKTVSSFTETELCPFVVVLKVASVNLYFLRSFTPGRCLLNGLPMINRKVYSFAPGSALQCPPDFTIYYSDIVAGFSSGRDIHPISFVAENISYMFSDGFPAITNISFSSAEGRLIGILGASGSGKTTLLNILTGLLKPDSGDVRINGISIFSGDEQLDGVIGYVPQDDMLVEELTIFENLYYAASLCFAGKSADEITDIVNQMLHTLGLYEKKGFRVGSPLNKVISGGQRKRLNIALELIRKPSLLFLDEPTTGLSSGDSENVMALLHDLSLRGTLVIMVIHQPSSEIFKGFDSILVLDMDGQLVYYGNPIESIVYFKKLESQINSAIAECPACGTVNPEILFNIIENKVVDEYGRYTDKRKVSPAEWAETFRRTCPAETVTEQHSKPWSSLRRPDWFKQTLVYMKRDIRSKLANKQYLRLTLLEGPILGVILSYIIRYIADPSSSIYIFRENENIPVYIFMSIIVALFLGLTISAEEIFRDRKMLRREHFLHLSRSSYLVGKITVLAVISALQTLLFLVVANPILGIKGMLMPYWIALFTTAFCANLIGLNISSALNSAITIYIVIPLLMIPMMVLSGAMFQFDKLNRKIASVDKVPLIAELMPTRWTYEALMVKQFKGNEYDRRVFSLKQQISISDFNTIYRIPHITEALETAINNTENKENRGNNKNVLALLHNEISSLSASNITEPFSGTDSITQDLFTAGLGERIAVWLNNADREYRRRSNLADMSLDNYISSNKTTLYTLYNNYHNDKLEDIARKVFEKNKILEYRNRFIQNADLIYLEPAASSPFDFRTHFMAPVKVFMGMKIDTFKFNILLVCLSFIILYVLLYTEALKHIISYFYKFRVQKRRSSY